MNHMPPFADLHKLTEDQRIDVIGHTLTCKDCRGKKEGPIEVALAIDDDAEKIKRYIAKLKAKFPTVTVTAILPGLVKGTKTLKLQGPA